MNKTLISLLFLILYLSSISTTVSGDTFNGVRNKTTASFDSAVFTKIDWTSIESNEFDQFIFTSIIS